MLFFLPNSSGDCVLLDIYAYDVYYLFIYVYRKTMYKTVAARVYTETKTNIIVMIIIIIMIITIIAIKEKLKSKDKAMKKIVTIERSENKMLVKFQ